MPATVTCALASAGSNPHRQARDLRQRVVEHALGALLCVSECFRRVCGELLAHHAVQVFGTGDDLPDLHLAFTESAEDGGRVIQRLGSRQLLDRAFTVARVGHLDACMPSERAAGDVLGLRLVLRPGSRRDERSCQCRDHAKTRSTAAARQHLDQMNK